MNFIDEAIELELNMSKLYGVFSEYIDEDRAFWYRLEVEEKNHAALLKTALDFIRFDKFPSGLVPDNLEILKESNQKIREAIGTFTADPDRKLAFKLAYALENSAGEVHFQEFMEKKVSDTVSEIFQKLNQADKDHAERILSCWKELFPGVGL